MSSADTIPIILNQQYTSDDVNNLQDIWAKWLNDAVGYGNSKTDLLLNTSSPAATNLVGVVLGGLEIIPDGTGVKIKRGALSMPTISSPSGDEPISGVELAFQLTDLHINMPSPGADTWYLVEAQVTETDDPTVSVPIWNGTAFVSTPGQVKRTRRVVNPFVSAGTASSIPALDIGFIPIAAVFRPAGGGAVSNAHIVDIRPFAPRCEGYVYDLQQNWWATSSQVAVSTTIAMRTRARCRHGDMAFGPIPGSSPTNFDPTSATFLETGGGAPAADEWWYMYLCPLVMTGQLGVRPRHLYASYASQGILVFTKKPPAAPGRRTNGSAITLPAPFASFTCAANEGVLVGMLKRDSGNTGWQPLTCNGDRVQAASRFPCGAGALPTVTLFTVAGTTHPIPAGAIAFDLQVSTTVAGSGSADMRLQNPSGTLQRYPLPYDATTVGAHVTFRDADLSLGQSYELGASGAIGGTYQADLLGFRI